MIRNTAGSRFTRLAAIPATLTLSLLALTATATTRSRTVRDDAGQATAEYALVLLGAAAIAMAIVSWVSNANPIGSLFDMVLGGLLGKAK